MATQIICPIWGHIPGRGIILETRKMDTGDILGQQRVALPPNRSVPARTDTLPLVADHNDPSYDYYMSHQHFSLVVMVIVRVSPASRRANQNLPFCACRGLPRPFLVSYFSSLEETSQLSNSFGLLEATQALHSLNHHAQLQNQSFAPHERLVQDGQRPCSREGQQTLVVSSIG